MPTSAETTAAPAIPAATFAPGRRGLAVVAVDRAAFAAGLRPGLPLAEARALRPDLRLARADGVGDNRRLAALADAARRYTPWTAAQRDAADGGTYGGGAGLWLDISGAAHLFGGEAALLQDLLARLHAAGFAAGAAVADTPGAAFAVARFGLAKGEAFARVPPGEQRQALAPLSVAALRLPAAVVDGLYRLGLSRIGDLLPLPRAPLVNRFGNVLTRRLDQALGQAAEPLSPRQTVPPVLVRRVFPEPIGREEDIAAALASLLAALCQALAARAEGARRLTLTAFHPDGGQATVTVGTSRPTRAPKPLARLFAERLCRLDRGFGIEVLVLAAPVVEPLAPLQLAIGGGESAADDVAALIDRLANRLGEGRVLRLAGRESHIPERAAYAIPAIDAAAEPSPPGRPQACARPLVLFAVPEAVTVVAPLPEGPPLLLRWRGRLRRLIAAEGPERIAPEWWREEANGESAFRDYYRTEDEQGLRLWVYRSGPYRPDRPARWFVHGLFG